MHIKDKTIYKYTHWFILKANKIIKNENEEYMPLKIDELLK